MKERECDSSLEKMGHQGNDESSECNHLHMLLKEMPFRLQNFEHHVIFQIGYEVDHPLTESASLDIPGKEVAHALNGINGKF